ncbi:non-canonical purine NTP pyrophosphatase [Candidatus Uhrbacteria bacterium]|nr:non-canonical purine NTP pyrophosphatase [Candidatus Uhrbacteria bacterium]
MKFYLGTTNQYKVRELASVLGPLQIPLVVTDPIDPEETGTTFAENAAIKARAYGLHVGNTVRELYQCSGLSSMEANAATRAAQLMTISEDSGIVIPALGGLPGPWSARFSDYDLDASRRRVRTYRPSERPREAMDAANNARVLELMSHIDPAHRAAKFVILLVVADTDGNMVARFHGEVSGWITTETRGTNGFGYDPIFASERSFGKTWAEIDSVRKNLLSHRKQALQEFTVWLGKQLRTGV